ncbi:MAG: 2-oxoacid:acceptor oxidoreductase family protein [Desulfovibrio sp.]
MSRYMDTIIAGFGGQGVLLIGNLLAYAGMKDDLNVTYIPVYGVEMRGGTANCTVVLSEEEIGSPLIQTPQSTIILNQPSLDKFQPRVADGGVQIINTALVNYDTCEKERIITRRIDANGIADKLGNARMVNMVALGAFIEATKIVSAETVCDCLQYVISPRYHKLIPANTKAIMAGAEELI